MPCQFANLNELWSRTIVETLRAKGVKYAVVCPGSRSSPLAFAFARTEGIEPISILDERSAGFFALGLAKREGAAAALVCTSGTAAANFFPAIVEASESGVPLIALTADRPPELRNCRAGQTIDQVGLYGSYPVDQAELALPESSLDRLRELRKTVGSFCDRSISPRSGPIHLNVPFRDPLSPLPDEFFENPISDEEWRFFFDGLDSAGKSRLVVDLDLSIYTDTDRGAIIIGATLAPYGRNWVDNVARLCAALKWPVLADALNPVRNHLDRFPYCVSGYDTICRSPIANGELVPEKVVVVGDLPISKTLRSWLKRNDVEMVFLNALGGNFDSTHGRSGNLNFNFNFKSPKVVERTSSAFAEKWLERDRRVQENVEFRLEKSEELFEGKVASTLSRYLPSQSSLFVSNSMPPRDMETFWIPNNRGIEVYSSRGANGIDGILSTAMGTAYGGKPSFLLTGDLALLHDSNGGLLTRVLEGSLTIVLINNSGGGIFEMLPVSALGQEFEQFFVTDQQIDFSNWAKIYGIDYVRPENWDELVALIERAPRKGVRLIEIITDRKADSKTRKQWFAEIAETLA
ncbi:MAG: 2-succinyl-5-enolpyruvyl-6-hydroxy-3-cyclohexene-1-carboxylic-acid synthase [Opitutales bacterium]|nr:2-succinyl-5-enolpyruvyl-6-hydroxy-3-cyclohexene-1-carboxylic-acid synthase [Opitutales bacterium]